MRHKNHRGRLFTTTILAGALAAIAAPAVLMTPAVAVAQDYTSGVLSGTVTNAEGAPVVGAQVAVRSEQGSVRTVTTGADGMFRMPALPIGVYQVEITAGAGSASSQVTVSPGGDAYAFVVAADETTTVDDIVVTASRIRDFNATDTGLTVNVQDFAERVPTTRSINAITLFTPGASQPDASINNGSRRNQSLVSLSGTSAAESVYYINGLNVTDQRSFLGYGELPFDFIRTIETKTGGYQAEYGRATGGVVNIVTRSGTNEWTGGVSTFWTPDSLRSERGLAYNPGGNNSAGVEQHNQYSAQDILDTTVTVGGPLWRDHLFFFGAYNIRDVESEGARTRNLTYNRTTRAITPAGTLSQTVSSYDDPRWAAKLDFVINPDHRLEATLINDKTTTTSQSRTFSATTGAQTAITDPINAEAGGLTQIYKYTGVFTDWLTLSALYGKVENSYLDTGNPISQPGIYDFAHPSGTPQYVNNGRQLGTYNLAGMDNRTTMRVDADLYFNLFGDHHVRVGYDQEELESVANSALNGGAYYTAYDANEINVVTFTNKGAFKATQNAFYIQDAWDVTDSLSLQLGLRNDRYDYKNAAGQSYIAVDDQWAPRLGFSWNPGGEGRSRVYGSFGDYYLPIATNTSIRASSGEVYTDEYYAITRDANGNIQVAADGRPVLGPRNSIEYLSPPGTPDPRSVVERDLKPMYEREFILGYEHRFDGGFLDGWSAGLRYVNRNLQSALEDTAVGDAVYRYCQRTNQMAACNPTNLTSSAFAQRFPYVIINPGDEAVVLVDLQGDTRTDPAGNANPAYNPQTITLTAGDLALPEVERKYEAFELTFERPFDGVWSLAGSYTLADSEGNYEGAVKSDVGQLDTSITQDFDHSANTLGAFGKLPNHHRHTLKVYGAYQVTEALNIGASFFGQSGRPYGCIGRVPTAVEPQAPQVGTPSGWYCPLGQNGATIQTPRGSRGTTPWTWQVDLNASYKLFERENLGSLVASVNVLNLFDNDGVVRVVEQGFIRNDATATLATDYTALSPYYGAPRTYQAPRTVRFGLSYRF